MKVLNFGSLNLDYVYQVPHFVQPGETLSATEQAVNAGGKGLNQSIALARAGAEVYHAGCIGSAGLPLKKLLEENGVNTAYLKETNALQGNAVIQVTPSGENSILLFGGSNQAVTKAQVDETLAAFGNEDALILQNEINEMPYIVEKAYERGMIIVLNPSPFNEKLDDVDFNKISWFLVNEIEAEQISGEAEPERAWAVIHEKYPKTSAVITLGKSGSKAFMVRADGTVEKAEAAAFEVEAVDTTAAGDTYTGYFIQSLLSGKTLEQSMEIASMASAISVTRPGAAPSVPLREEVEEKLKV